MKSLSKKGEQVEGLPTISGREVKCRVGLGLSASSSAPPPPHKWINIFLKRERRKWLGTSKGENRGNF